MMMQVRVSLNFALGLLDLVFSLEVETGLIEDLEWNDDDDDGEGLRLVS